MLRRLPARFRASCCSSSLLMSGWFHSEKKNRGSQYFFIMASIVGLQAALPMKQITKSNSLYIWNKRWLIAVDFPVLRAPTHPITNGSTSFSVAGSQVGSILLFN